MAPPVAGHFEKVHALAAQGRFVALGGARPSAASRVTVYDHVANKTLSSVDLDAHVNGLAFANDLLLAACSDGVLRAWHVSTEGALTHAFELSAHAGSCNAVAVGPGAHLIATAGHDGAARVWSLGDRSKLRELALSSAPLYAVAFDLAGEYLAAAGEDSVVRAVTLSTGAVRAMPGHDGAVRALTFTPRDGRLASAGDDGVVRLWYLVGAVEFEARGGDDSGHKGPVYALLFGPTPGAQADGSDPGDRVYSAGADGKVKVWRLEDRRKPRSLDAGAVVRALCFATPASGNRTSLGSAIAGGDARVLSRFNVDLAGLPAEQRNVIGSGFEALAEELKGQKPARESAVKALAALEEPEALAMLVAVMTSDKDVAVRALAVSEAGARLRRNARTKFRELLDDGQPMVRNAALTSLRAVDGESTLGPLRAALASKHGDIRITALRALPALREASPLVPGMVAEKLTDADATVRVTALDELTRLHPAGSVEPLRAAYERGPADLKAEVLVRAALAGMVTRPEIAAVVSRALDDDDATVRRYAFTVKVLDRAALMAALSSRDESLGRTVTEIARRVAVLRRATPDVKAPSDAEIRAAREAIPSQGGRAVTEGDLEPLLTALACRTPDTALRGARALAQLGDTRALGALLQISREADAGLRRECAAALQELKDGRALKRLVWMLDDADPGVRGAALDAYARFEGEAPIEVAENALRSSHEDIRVRGLDRLVKLGPGDATDVLLGDAVEDESSKVRGEAFKTLWAWHEKEPEKALDRALAARFPDLRLRAVAELATLAPRHPWALERLYKTVTDRDVNVGLSAHAAVLKLQGDGDAEAHLAAMSSTHAAVRVAGAKGALKSDVAKVRAALSKLLSDDDRAARSAALDTLDGLLPQDAGAHHAALQSAHLDLRVQAASLLSTRHDEALVDPMRALLADKDLARTVAAPLLASLRQGAAIALATLGAQWLVKYFATELLKDDDARVREEAARGIATAARHGDEGYLLDALGHTDAWVRSWAADGLSRLGDVRALPVLTGNLRNDHLPIRLGAILSFAALGADGAGGMLQGLEDPSREVQEMVFAIVLARDLRAFRRGEAPELLTSAVSSQRPDVRFAAARALELRTDPETYLTCLLEALSPPRPDAKAASIKDWPSEEHRGRALVGLAGALASDNPAQRYAAAQVLNLRKKPVEFFREAERASKLRLAGAAWVPDTQPRPEAASDAKPPAGWLRKLFAGDSALGEVASRDSVPTAEQQHLRRLAFGAYVGLLRQGASDEEGQRVRRDAIDRIVELGLSADVGVASAVPALSRALDDGHHLVRKAAFAGLKRLYPEGADEPLTLALGAQGSDVARAALDELAARGDAALPRIALALNARLPDVRRYAFELLERLSPRGSLDPLLAALSCEHADLRVGVIERLATSNDDRVIAALTRALGSDHDDLRMRAAELLATRRHDGAVDPLAGFLRSDDVGQVRRATEALVALGSVAAVRALAARVEELSGAPRAALVRDLGRARNAAAIESLVARFDDEDATVRAAAFDAVVEIAGRDREKRDHALLLTALRAAVRARDAAVRVLAANELDAGDDSAANDLLAGLFGDREVTVRQAAVYRYARRVINKGAPVGPLEAVLRAGERTLVLPAAEGVASKGLASALRPLLLVVRAGEAGERERALLALGTLGDARALEEIEVIAAGGTVEEPVEPSMKAAAIEALGRLANRLTDADARLRVIDKVEQAALDGLTDARCAAVRGLRYVGGERGRAAIEAVLAAPAVATPVATAVAEALGALGDLASEATLAAMLDGYDPPTRKSARAALEKLFPGDRTRVELRAVDSRWTDVSEPAATFLATEGDPATLVTRLASLRNPALRSRLRYGLLRRGAAPAAALATLLEHDDASVREEAAKLLGAYTGGDVERSHTKLSAAERATLQSALIAAQKRAASAWKATPTKRREPEARVWTRTLWAATRLGATSAVPAARELVGASDDMAPASVRRVAARALEALGSAADVDALTAALRDSDGDVRSAAARAIEALAPDRAASIAASVKPFDAVSFSVTARRPSGRGALLGSDAGRRLALASMITAGESGPLVALASSATVELAARLDAVSSLGRIGGDDAVTALTALAFDKKQGDAAFRKAAYRALRRARRADARRQKETADR